MKSDGSFSIGSEVWPGVSKLIEEMGELHQVLGKLIALHGEVEHWDGSNLRERLVEETADVRAAISFVTLMNCSLDEMATAEARAAAKLKLFCEWQGEQRSSGVVPVPEDGES